MSALRLDVENGWVWRGPQRLEPTPKAFGVLRYLVEHPHRLVSKAELLRAIWPEVVVSEWVLTSCIWEIRKLLGDRAQAPHYIETVHRRGYRFIGALQCSTPPPRPLTPHLVGREAELRCLHGCLEKARGGERQIVFITGEPGIGKTALLDAFLAQSAATGDLWIGQGQCIEHYGAGEAYLPVLAALGQLARGPQGPRLRELLSRQAPSWALQMPALLSPSELAALQRQTLGATRERMLREMAEAVAVLTAERPLLLVLEDLQWSDYSTLDLVSALARHREAARLLLVGSYRPVEVIVQAHPLKGVKQDLQAHGQCAELALEGLGVAHIAEYLRHRFTQGTHPPPLPRLAEIIFRRTEGNPLFMVNVVDDWLRQEAMVQRAGRWELQQGLAELAAGIPENLRQLIERQLAQLSPEELRLLEVASVAGEEFAAAAVAAGLEEEIVEVEERCAGLVRHEQFLRSGRTAQWPDRRAGARYGFRHALYQKVLYQRVASARRVQLHKRIGEQQERAYGERAEEIAAELALHFEQGRDYPRAVCYLRRAGENALRRFAHHEAIHHLTKALALLESLPDTPERAQQEITLQMALTVPVMMTKGYSAPELERIYTRARALCQQLEETPQLFPVLFGLLRFYVVRGKLQAAPEIGERLLKLARKAQDPALLVIAHVAMGGAFLYLGEFIAARPHLEEGLALYDPRRHRLLTLQYGEDPGVVGGNFEAYVLWLRGHPDQALKKNDEVLRLAEALSHPLNLVGASFSAATLYQFCREAQAAQKQLEAMTSLAIEQGFGQWLAQGAILRGWALAEQGRSEQGIAQMCQGLAAYRDIGGEHWLPYFLGLLAEAYGKAGQAEEGLSMLTEALALVDKSGKRFYEAELYRLKGELLLIAGRKTQNAEPRSQKTKSIQASALDVQRSAEECFDKAIAIARQQCAKSLELRAVMSLTRLRQQQGKTEEARKPLAEVYGWFTEGFDSKDLQEARALLQSLRL